MSPSWSSLLALAAFAASFGLGLLARRVLGRFGIVDTPNPRSSHDLPVPRGGGIGFVAVILIAWGGLALAGVPGLPWPVLAGAAAVAAVSMADDIREVNWGTRFAVQAAAVSVGMLALPVEGPILAPGLPVILDRAIVGLAWLWFVNLFNFMDGIDGIAATEATVVSFGIVAIALLAGRPDWPVLPALVAGAAVAGFLPLNVPEARVFMGDVGSVTLGFVLGWLLILIAAEGGLAAALLLSLYFTLDATTTLVRRGMRGESLLEPHRHHAYQRAVDRGLPHPRVTLMVAALGVMLVVLGGFALDRPVPALGLGLAVTGVFILWLRGYFAARRAG